MINRIQTHHHIMFFDLLKYPLLQLGYATCFTLQDWRVMILCMSAYTVYFIGPFKPLWSYVFYYLLSFFGASCPDFK